MRGVTDLVAVTDRRLLLFSSEPASKLRVRAEVPRELVRGARRRAHGFHLVARGRVEVTFTDALTTSQAAT